MCDALCCDTLLMSVVSLSAGALLSCAKNNVLHVLDLYKSVCFASLPVHWTYSPPFSFSLHTLHASTHTGAVVGDGGRPPAAAPTVTSREAQRLGLGYSLFERVQAMGATTCLLDTPLTLPTHLSTHTCQSFTSHQHRPRLSKHPPRFNTQAQSLVMVGDPRQLPPTVTSREAQRLGLGFSLFERVQAMGATTCLLDTQYRMHPKLAEFPSVKFYKGLLQSWPRPEDRLLPDGLQWPNPQVCEMAAVM